MKYTFKNLKEDFSTEAACLAHIFRNRYPNGLECPKCHKKDFYAVAGRRSYASSCGFQTYPTEGTIFHKSPTPLVSWFHAIFLMSQSKNGVAAKELERQLGVTYKCAWRIAKQIRLLMREDLGPLGGVVEADETYIGGKVKGVYGRNAGGKVPVFGVMERGGRIKAKVVADTKRTTLIPEIQASVKPGTMINTDASPTYAKVDQAGYGHASVNHSAGEFVRAQIHTNSIDGFWSQLKRSVNGTYHSVSKKHLQTYLDEFSFRYDHRKDVEPMPLTMFARVGMHA